MSYTDLRDFLKLAEAHGEPLKRISNASAELEMAGIAEIVHRGSKQPKPLLLFDDIPGYEKGYRTLFGLVGSPWQIAKTLGLPEDQLENMELLKNWRKKSKGNRLIPPKFVKTGPVLENTMTGDKIDLSKFPAPRMHEYDAKKPFIGTAVCVVQKDLEEGWLNAGTYRVMVVDKNHVTFHAIEGQHGTLITDKYRDKKKVMPVLIVLGADPAFYWASTTTIRWGISEYDWTGGIKGEPMEVIEGPFTGLPMPANAEIVIEGEWHPNEEVDEGPFGEWHGYYANLGLASCPEPLIRVKAIHYRNDPIITCAHETVPPHDDTLAHAITRSEQVWNRVEGFGLQGIKGIWCHEVGNGSLFNVISIEQLYSGHSLLAGELACQAVRISGRYTIVVEEDIDPTNLEEVIWAMETRCMPDRTTLRLIERCRGASSDPAILLSEKRKYASPPKPLYANRVIIDACRPYEHKADWYPMDRLSPELRAKIINKWRPSLSDIMPTK